MNAQINVLLAYFQQGNMLINMIFLSSITLIIFYFYFLIVPASNVKGNSPPCPPRLPIIGNLHLLGSLPHRSLQALAAKYGSTMLLYMGSVPTIIISSPKMACEVLKTHDLIFASRPSLSIPKRLLYSSDIAFAPLGDYWRKVRKIGAVHLLSTKMVQSFSHIRYEEVSLMVRRIRASQNDLVNLSELLIVLTNDVICRAALGKKYYEGIGDARKIRATLNDFFELIGAFPIEDYIPWLAWLDSLSGLNSKVSKVSKELDEFLEIVLEEHLQARRSENSSNPKKDRDFVDVLQDLNVENENGDSLEKDNIKALILDMFAGGTDTTLSTIEWAMAELISSPKIMKRAQEEIRGIVGSMQNASIQNINDSNVNKMIYLKAIIKETLRLHPPLPLLVPRETTEDIKLNGYCVSKGTRVMVNIWAIGRDPSLWVRAEEFDPDRFIDCKFDFNAQDFQHIPFGGGRRVCPGMNFALPTIELALANMLCHFDWEVPKGLEKEVLDMSETPGITTHKKSGLVLIAKECVV